MSTSVNIFRNSGSSSSSGGGGGGGTAVGKSVYLYIDPLEGWDEDPGSYYNDLWDFQFSNDEYRLIAVTTDGNIPREDRQNVLFLVSTNNDEACEVMFKLEREQEIFNARIHVYTAEPPR